MAGNLSNISNFLYAKIGGTPGSEAIFEVSFNVPDPSFYYVILQWNGGIFDFAITSRRSAAIHVITIRRAMDDYGFFRSSSGKVYLKSGRWSSFFCSYANAISLEEISELPSDAVPV